MSNLLTVHCEGLFYPRSYILIEDCVDYPWLFATLFSMLCIILLGHLSAVLFWLAAGVSGVLLCVLIEAKYFAFGCQTLTVCCYSFQYIIISPRRSTAEAVQILVSHLLGDAGSPWLVGVVRVSRTLTSFVVLQAFQTLIGQKNHLLCCLVRFVIQLTLAFTPKILLSRQTQPRECYRNMAMF